MSKEQIVVPPLDAEKTTKNQLIENFRWPPDLDKELTRSTLLIGTRGAGKTMFLRRCRHQGPGLSIYADLRKILNPITSDTGAAGLSFREIPASQEQAIRAKAIVLLAQWLFASVWDNKVPLDISLLQRVLPPDLRSHTGSSVPEYLDSLREAIEVAPLGIFAQNMRQSAFEDLLQRIGETVKEGYGSLTLLLDRAEEIPYPGLPPVMQLLDQRHEFLTVVASRPGILGPDHQMSYDVPVPGDHYNLKHLGSSPYSAEWKAFMAEALDAWLPREVTNISDDELSWLLFVARDSMRNALEILYNALDAQNVYDAIRARKQLSLIRDTQLKAAQGQMRRLNDDLGGLVRRVRQRLGTVKLPVAVSIGGLPEPSLFSSPRHIREMTRDEQTIYLGLRTGFFTTMDGFTWHPFRNVECVEIPPLFIWEEGDQWSTI